MWIYRRKDVAGLFPLRQKTELNQKVLMRNPKPVERVLASRVREAMLRVNVDEDNLAEETHIPQPRLREILAGRGGSTTFFEIVAFATVLGQSIESLVS